MDKREAVKVDSELLQKAKRYCSVQGMDISEYIEDLIRKDMIQDMIKDDIGIKDKKLLFKK